MTAALRFPLTLYVEGEPALAEALAATGSDTDVWASAALLICRREAVTLVRRSLVSYNVRLQLAVRHSLDGPVELHWGNALREHPHVISQPLEGDWVHLLVVPRCSLSDQMRSFSCSHRIVMGRTRQQLLGNAYRCLMALSPFPLHPSWEKPVMEYFLTLTDQSLPPLRLFPEGGVLHFAQLDIEAATWGVKWLWKERALPIPDIA